MKMKVRVSKLQAAIEKHVKQDAVRFERETEKYAIAEKKAREKYVERLMKYTADVRARRHAGELRSFQSSSARLRVPERAEGSREAY